MDAEYDRRQRYDQWPVQRWSLDGTPEWYRDLLKAIAGNLTAWRQHDPGQCLDPRTDPRIRRDRARMERRHAQG